MDIVKTSHHFINNAYTKQPHKQSPHRESDSKQNPLMQIIEFPANILKPNANNSKFVFQEKT
jgi:hypothetical protein